MRQGGPIPGEKFGQDRKGQAAPARQPAGKRSRLPKTIPEKRQKTRVPAGGRSRDEHKEIQPDLTYLSLGWGVQSFCLASMIALGELPMIDLAIHADTGHETQGTYEHARAWTPWLTERGLRVETLHPRDNRVVRTDWGIGSIQIPAYTLNRTTGSEGMIDRQCTRQWKIMPIQNRVRELLRERGGARQPREGAARSLQGISLDEWRRMKDSRVRYIQHQYPLVDLRMTRQDCISWLQSHGLPVPPKSACVFCPYHRAAQWKEMKREDGPDWRKAQEIDRDIRNRRDFLDLFVHNARRPLEEAVRIPQDRGLIQMEMDLEAPCDSGHCFT